MNILPKSDASGLLEFDIEDNPINVTGNFGTIPKKTYTAVALHQNYSNAMLDRKRLARSNVEINNFTNQPNQVFRLKSKQRILSASTNSIPKFAK